MAPFHFGIKEKADRKITHHYNAGEPKYCKKGQSYTLTCAIVERICDILKEYADPLDLEAFHRTATVTTSKKDTRMILEYNDGFLAFQIGKDGHLSHKMIVDGDTLDPIPLLKSNIGEIKDMIEQKFVIDDSKHEEEDEEEEESEYEGNSENENNYENNNYEENNNDYEHNNDEENENNNDAKSTGSFFKVNKAKKGGRRTRNTRGRHSRRVPKSARRTHRSRRSRRSRRTHRSRRA